MRTKNKERIEQEKTKLEKYFEIRHNLNDRVNEIISLFGTGYDPIKHFSGDMRMGDWLNRIKQKHIDTPDFKGVVVFHETYDPTINPEADTGSRNELYILGQSGDRIVEFSSHNGWIDGNTDDHYRIVMDADLITSSLDSVISYMRNSKSTEL